MNFGTLTGGIGTPSVFNRDFVPQTIVIGNITGFTLDLQSISIVVGGKPTIQIEGISHVDAFSAFVMSMLAGGGLGRVVRVSSGFISNTSFQMRLINNSAFAKEVYGSSEDEDGLPVLAAQATIQANDSMLISNFEGLIFDPSNIRDCLVNFKNGFSDTLDPIEFGARYVSNYPVDGATGTLDGLQVVENLDDEIESVTLYTTSGGDCLLTKINIA